MKIKQIVLAVGLAVVGLSASATTYDFGALDTFGPNGESNEVKGLQGVFDDKYTFTLGVLSNGDSQATSFDTSFKGVTETNITGGTVSLFEVGHAGSLGTYSFGSAGTYTPITGLGAGSYYYEVSGTGSGRLGGTYDFSASAAPVPEPGSAALLMAGLGLMGFMARRRKS